MSGPTSAAGLHQGSAPLMEGPGLRRVPAPVLPGTPWSALAPMQDVTALPFMRVVAARAVPDLFFTEFFRVHAHSRLEPPILRAITANSTGRPVFAQLIGEDPVAMVRTCHELQQYPIAGIDLNLGCPAPKVYRKNVGGGLLREVSTVDRLLGRLREAVAGLLTVKMRIGFEDDRHFDGFLDLIRKHQIDLLSVHGRTVRQMYRGEVHLDHIRHAARSVPCPVLANGNIQCAEDALAVLQQTGAAGVMIGRAAIRNPWIFGQVRALLAARAEVPCAPAPRPTLGDVRLYIDDLRAELAADPSAPRFLLGRLKKFLNFIALGVDPEGAFLKAMRLAPDLDALLQACDRFLSAPDRASLPFPDRPWSGLVARPNQE